MTLLLYLVPYLSVRSSYVGIQPDGTKVTSDTGVDNWKHKDNKNKTIYNYGKDDKIESKDYHCPSCNLQGWCVLLLLQQGLSPD
jgi:hypothetical protein